MPLVSVTRLRLRSAWFLLPFIWSAQRSAGQARKSAGNLGVQLRKTKGLTFWTLTQWENEAAMKQFMVKGPHRTVMPKLAGWCDEAAYAHWTVESHSAPTWEQAAERLREGGHLSKVLHPSEDHRAGTINTE